MEDDILALLGDASIAGSLGKSPAEAAADVYRHAVAAFHMLGFSKDISYSPAELGLPVGSQGVSDFPEEVDFIPPTPNRRFPMTVDGPNGKLDISKLVSIGRRSDGMYGGHHLLQPEAASAWLALQQAARSDGIKLTVTSAYRSAEHQARLSRVSSRAAPAGRSVHGLGYAVDIAELYFSPGAYGGSSVAGSAAMRRTPTFRWMDRNGPKFGWFNPPGLRDGRGLDESWHFEYYGPKG